MIFSKEVSLLNSKKPGLFPGFGQLNLRNVPATAGKTKMGQFQAIAGKSPRNIRELRLTKYFPAISGNVIAGNIIRPANAFITVLLKIVDDSLYCSRSLVPALQIYVSSFFTHVLLVPC